MTRGITTGIAVGLASLPCLSLRAEDVIITIESEYLGTASRCVENLDIADTHELSRQAALLALDPEGWNLAAREGSPLSFGPPDQPAWEGGTEWSAFGIPGELSDDFGYELNDEAIEHGGHRHLIFHTDDTVSLGAHNICEPMPFGRISGLMDGAAYQCGRVHWGLFRVERLCRADLDGDQSVTTSDLLLVLAQWGPCPSECLADITGDGTVDTSDLLEVLGAWGPCSGCE